MKHLILIFLLTSCLGDNLSNERATGSKANTPKPKVPSTKTPGSGWRTAGPSDGSVDQGEEKPPTPIAVELKYIIDPYTSSYQEKVTLPKNFAGILFIAGLNISVLNNMLVKVRFRFGRQLEPVVVEATVGGTAPGVTPQVSMQVLQLDFASKPFERMRLLYHLFDYNDYRDETTGVEVFRNENGELTGPTTDPMNKFLYCRGLNLRDDPTFEGSTENQKCDKTGERCLYTYASLRDKGLIDDDQLAFNPSEPQIDVLENGYVNEPSAKAIQKCLPDNNFSANLQGVLNAESVGTGSSTLQYNDPVVMKFGMEEEMFFYQGPFRALDSGNWQIEDLAITYESSKDLQPLGIYQKNYQGQDPNAGYISMLFPRSGKMTISRHAQYWGSKFVLGERFLQDMVSSGDTLFMDGCNLRVNNLNFFSNEGLSSCNLTGTIEVFTINEEGNEVNLLREPEQRLKIQIIRPSLKEFTDNGTEVLYQSMKYCSNNSSCATGECCFNNRCWARNLISRCARDDEPIGFKGIGENCNSDFQCSSLCCDQSRGVCAVHIISEEETTLCAKSPGQTCVDMQFCRMENLTTCKVVKTGTDVLGKVECALRCYYTPTFGRCRNGICVSPSQPSVPAFNPADPDCSEAIDPPIVNDNGRISGIN